ncbi:protein IQ-DOMAIN 2 [Mercurialis annua]|uniref:protein IQ-DOMAIN 2 n=1 Tax=Mercurialis annua TaxID=3986 RepID=UPI0021609D23|nr:protein IQ-DOMAIN 2 [Mercurialis annua]
MGKNGKWFSSVKKALSPDSKGKKEQKSKKRWFGKHHQLDSDSTSLANVRDLSPPPIPPPYVEEVKTIDTTNEQNQHGAYSVPADVAVEPVVYPVETPVEVVRVVKVNKFAGKSGEEAAAMQIQTAFRGYLARRALRALRGLVRLKSLMEGPTVKRQATHTLRCMQTLARVQSQIHSRRARMSEENQALQRQLLQKHAQELEKLRMGEEWDDSLQSKEQIEANLLHKYEAAMRRERALAYSFSHQKTLKNPSRSANPMFMMSSGNPEWGWSWLERWMAAHPWEKGGMAEKELSNDHSSVKSGSRSMVGGEISKSYARFQLNSDKISPVDSEKMRQTKSPRSPLTPKPAFSAVARKVKSASPRSSIGGADDDNRSMISVQSDRFRRHSIAGSSVRDDESLGSSSTVPSYMVATESARAKSRLQSPAGVEQNGTPEKEKGPLGPARKRLSYPPSPARARRQSVPKKVEFNNINAEIAVASGQG